MMILDEGNKEYISYLLKSTDEDAVLEVVAFLGHRWGLAPYSEAPTDDEWATTESEVYGLMAAIKAGVKDGSITAAAPTDTDSAPRGYKMTDADTADVEFLARMQEARS